MGNFNSENCELGFKPGQSQRVLLWSADRSVIAKISYKSGVFSVEPSLDASDAELLPQLREGFSLRAYDERFTNLNAVDYDVQKLELVERRKKSRFIHKALSNLLSISRAKMILFAVTTSAMGSLIVFLVTQQ